MSKVARWVFGVCASIVFIFAGLAFFFVIIRDRPDISYDQMDGDYAWLLALIDSNAPHAGGEELAKDSKIDFSKLNHGDWKVVCATGGYVNPIKLISSFGGLVSEQDRQRLEGKERGSRISIVEEYEFMISYVKSDGTAHFIHFEHGIGTGGQHFQECIKRPTDVMLLGQWVPHDLRNI